MSKSQNTQITLIVSKAEAEAMILTTANMRDMAIKANAGADAIAPMNKTIQHLNNCLIESIHVDDEIVITMEQKHYIEVNKLMAKTIGDNSHVIRGLLVNLKTIVMLVKPVWAKIQKLCKEAEEAVTYEVKSK